MQWQDASCGRLEMLFALAEGVEILEVRASTIRTNQRRPRQEHRQEHRQAHLTRLLTAVKMRMKLVRRC